MVDVAATHRHPKHFLREGVGGLPRPAGDGCLEALRSAAVAAAMGVRRERCVRAEGGRASGLSARSLLALLEECNPDPSDNRANSRECRQ